MYEPLPTSIPRSRAESSDDDCEKPHIPRKYPAENILRHIFIIVLVTSLLLNISLTASWFRYSQKIPDTSVSTRFAGLARTIPKPWTALSGDNATQQDALWNKQTNYDRGNIALDDDYAKAMGLPRAQRFPWDSSKGIYLINAYHNLHCVQTLRTAVVEFNNSTPQSSPLGHVIHCLNVLRDEIICDADDTPRYTGFQPNQKSGLGQVRMCRDWTQLEAWADDHTACWRHIGDISDPGFRELDRYRFCPEGSPYAQMAKIKWLHHDE